MRAGDGDAVATGGAGNQRGARAQGFAEVGGVDPYRVTGGFRKRIRPEGFSDRIGRERMRRTTQQEGKEGLALAARHRDWTILVENLQWPKDSKLQEMLPDSSVRAGVSAELIVVVSYVLVVPTRSARSVRHLADELTERQLRSVALFARCSTAEVARFAGMSRENINRQLGAWADGGVIALEHGRIRILDATFLSEIAASSE